MERNVGETDRLVRIALGAVSGLASLGILGGVIAASGGLALVLGLVAIVLLATGTAGTCGAYQVLGVNTCKR
ncbi:DUF2892 family protein [Halalkaliarchaeum sp. AArc-CO]|uniref:YgaP family membrane protein n=1 Tax=unclassified Halalkaliarchaeum TaxID=2678344 RepID=UPI00217E2BC0|nr:MULTISPECIES: DUF2892 domain-containing protein [unclassified Halalkaliarchaeum]MDR5673805.1 DUF2892 domain-containing protein [Halalkaliarchaeum sp. AArc-GB]UWG50983.1 DUF2892 family protein [Halalkaliarchaeum sp. AArc-CO]